LVKALVVFHGDGPVKQQRHCRNDLVELDIDIEAARSSSHTLQIAPGACQVAYLDTGLFGNADASVGTELIIGASVVVGANCFVETLAATASGVSIDRVTCRRILTGTDKGERCDQPQGVPARGDVSILHDGGKHVRA
jgi:hypothetical protein